MHAEVSRGEVAYLKLICKWFSKKQCVYLHMCVSVGMQSDTAKGQLVRLVDGTQVFVDLTFYPNSSKCVH